MGVAEIKGWSLILQIILAKGHIRIVLLFVWYIIQRYKMIILQRNHHDLLSSFISMAATPKARESNISITLFHSHQSKPIIHWSVSFQWREKFYAHLHWAKCIYVYMCVCIYIYICIFVCVGLKITKKLLHSALQSLTWSPSFFVKY